MLIPVNISLSGIDGSYRHSASIRVQQISPPALMDLIRPIRLLIWPICLPSSFLQFRSAEQDNIDNRTSLRLMSGEVLPKSGKK
jgi:hypothetical protein